jgi:holo-[acyl-carrier protein] synthase
VKNEEGKPIVNLYNNALKTAEEKNISCIHLSITHVKEYALAYAIAE